MQIEFANLSPNQRYHLMTQTVIPRPIAWILTRNENQSFNLAPFSYFAALSSDPPLVVVSIGNKPDGQDKDTKHNLGQQGECILHIPGAELAEAVNSSAAGLPYGESELSDLGLDLVDFVDGLPRIAQANIAMHCRVWEMHKPGNAPQTACYLEVLSLFVNDNAIKSSNNRLYINSQEINPLSRLGGSDYAVLGKRVTLKRPD